MYATRGWHSPGTAWTAIWRFHEFGERLWLPIVQLSSMIVPHKFRPHAWFWARNSRCFGLGVTSLLNAAVARLCV
jgi:hypothetical protein